MSADWYPGIRAFCAHWHHAPMLQQTFETMESAFLAGQDACIDAAKCMVECACRIVIDELDDPQKPQKPEGTDAAMGHLLGAATRLLKLGDVRHRKFADLIKHHNKITDSLRELRNEAGTVSHGKDGFIAKLSEHHRRAAVLSADAIIAFLHFSYMEQEPDPIRSNEPYERFETSNSLIDSFAYIANLVEDEGGLSFVIRLPDEDEIPITVEISRILFSIDREAYKQAVLAAQSAQAASGNASE